MTAEDVQTSTVECAGAYLGNCMTCKCALYEGQNHEFSDGSYCPDCAPEREEEHP